MSAIFFKFSKVVRAGRTLANWLMIILGIVVTSGFVWMLMDQVFAPPGWRLMDGLWRVFICRCQLSADVH